MTNVTIFQITIILSKFFRTVGKRANSAGKVPVFHGTARFDQYFIKEKEESDPLLGSDSFFSGDMPAGLFQCKPIIRGVHLTETQSRV